FGGQFLAGPHEVRVVPARAREIVSKDDATVIAALAKEAGEPSADAVSVRQDEPALRVSGASFGTRRKGRFGPSHLIEPVDLPGLASRESLGGNELQRQPPDVGDRAPVAHHRRYEQDKS